MPESQLDRMERTVQRISQRVDLLISLARSQLSELFNMATSLDSITEQVTAIETVDQSIITLVKQLADMVAELKPNQEAIDALAARLRTSAEAVAKAVTDNTPAAP